jgi:hypothetical protein
MDEEKIIVFVQGHECLYNLQHKDYNNLVKDNFWKEIAGELHAQDKELSRTQHCPRMAGTWQDRGRVAAGERQGNGMVCVNRPSEVTQVSCLFNGFLWHACVQMKQ